jgi:hypothetical protein
MDKAKVDAANEQIKELQKEIGFDTKDYPIEVLVKKFEDADLFIPSYQRQFIWSDTSRCNFIESILLGLPIPFMFFSDNDDGRYEIIDGAQRTSTLEQFVNNDLTLTGLEKLSSLEGFTFLDLPVHYQRKFLGKTLRIIFLSEDTSIEVRKDIFKRINSGGVEANPIEIRRGTHAGEFMDFIASLCTEELFIKNCPISEKVKKRYEDEELILRFFAYFSNYKQFDHSVNEFIDSYVLSVKDSFDNEEMKALFTTMLKYVDKYFPNGFRKTPNAKSTPRVRFESISVGVALALNENPDIEPISMDWLSSDEFKKHTTTHASNSPARVSGRIEYVMNKLLEEE